MAKSTPKASPKATGKISVKSLAKKKFESTAGDFCIADSDTEKIVLYFYPKDATPGCTLEGHEFSKLLPQFKKLGANVYGISRDSLSSHEKFRDKQCYSVHLISDSEEILCKAFDVIKEKNMYGKKVMGIERSTFVLDKKGELLGEWRKVKAEGHALEVLNRLKEMD